MLKRKNTSLSIRRFSLIYECMFYGLILCCYPMFSNAQTKAISGTVSEYNKTTIPGVTVSVKGAKIFAQTDANGRYNISAPIGSELIFTSIGYIAQSIKVGNETTINITLTASTTGLNEVVVVGYGTQKRSDITGSISTVNIADVQKAPVRSIEEALAGRVAGVQVTSSDGRPGSGIDIVIRGNNSITQENSPLYVIDGFPIENPNNNVINPQDVASIEILKDASATAIYGARGANGVIVITTKKGIEGKPVFNFDASYGLQQNLKKLDLMSPYEFVKYQIELDPTPVSSNNYKSPTELYLSDGKTLDYYNTVDGVDMQDQVLRTAPMQNYNLSVTGGSKTTKYAVSGSLIDQDGILINSNYKRYQGRVVVDQDITKKITVGINTNYSFLQASGINPAMSTGSSTTNIMVSVWGIRPVGNTSNIQDFLQDPDINPANDYRVNPFINLSNLSRVTKTNNLKLNAYAEYKILPSLKLRVTGGVNENRSQADVFNNSKTQYGYPGNNNGINGSINHHNFSNWLNENTLTYSKKFNKVHDVNILTGFTVQKQTSESYGRGATQIPDESLGLGGIDQGVAQRIDSLGSVWTMASFLGRVNYGYRSKYLLTASLRADGSSKFPTENHWSYFPSAAFSWRFINENIFKNSKILSDGKLRTSYGITGNNRVGDFDYLTTFYNPINSSYVFNNTYINGVVATNLGNSKLKWETTEQSNIGIDLGFFKQRIQFTADVYRKNTKDLLLFTSLPSSSGFSFAYRNVGKVRNQGLELSLSTVNISKKDFSWTSNFNISFNKSKVLGLNDNQVNLQSQVNWDNQWSTTSAYITQVGSQIGLMYGYISDGTYKYEDFDKDNNGVYTLKSTVTANGNSRSSIQPGDVKYKDLTGDLNVTAADYTVIGRGLPIHTGGFNNNFTYKNFDLGVFFQWSYGNDLLNANRIMFEGNTINRPNFNQFSSYEDRWTPTNSTSDIFRTKGYFGGGYASQYVEDGSYLRLKTVSLGYNFKPQLLKNIRVKTIRVYASAQNLATWTNYSGSDPEVNTYSSALTSGFDFSAYPRARTITFGTNISF